MTSLPVFIAIIALTGSFLESTQAAKVPTNLAWLFDFNGNSANAEKPQRSLCESEECKKMAQVVKESMNDNVDPCDDFYEYACGNWANNNPIPEGYESWSLWSMVGDRIDKQIENIVRSPATPDDVLPVKLAKKFYRVCMDTDAMNARGLDPILSILSRGGGWPLIMEPDEWDEHVHPWQKVDDYYVRLMSMSSVYDLTPIKHEEIGKFLLFDSPHFPPKAYVLIPNEEPEDNGDVSDENDRENSQEEGSHQTEDSAEKLAKRLRNSRVSRKRKINAAVKAEKRAHRNKVGKKQKSKRTKREIFRRSDDPNSEELQRRRHNRKVNRHSSKKMNSHKNKVTLKTSKHPLKTHTKKNHAMQNGHEETLNRGNKRIGRHHRYNVEDEDMDTNEKDEDENNNENGDADDYDETGSGDVDNDDEDDDNDNEDDNEDDDEDDSNEDNDSDDEDDEEEDEEAFRQRMLLKYKQYILAVANTFIETRDVEIPKEKLEKDIDDLIQFQIQLYKLTDNGYDLLNATLSEFDDWYSGLKPKTRNGKISWTKKIEKLFSEAGIELDEDPDMFVICQPYVEGLRELLDETPSETIVNYIHWNFLSHTLGAMTKDMRILAMNWSLSSFDDEKDVDDPSERADICVGETKMSDIIGYEYVKEHFSDDILQTAKDMIDDIEKEVEYQIKESHWMDEHTKDFVLDKLVNIKKLIGYPDWYRNETVVKRLFRGVIVGPSHFENLLNYKRYEKWTELKKFVSEEPESDWVAQPTLLNAFFIPDWNSITVTAADFQHPLFAYHRPQLINFGIIGFVMAHEVNHGFDNNGRIYNKNGDVMEWLSTMAQAYNKRAECFVDQFNGYSIIKGENATIENYGNQTTGENIADTMGLQAVYRAYKRRERECGKPEDALPGLENLTNDQLFFLSFANLWCEVVDPETEKLSARFDEHSTGRLRVIGSVSNSFDFAKAYDCPVGSPMNPEKKCNIWK